MHSSYASLVGFLSFYFILFYFILKVGQGRPKSKRCGGSLTSVILPNMNALGQLVGTLEAENRKEEVGETMRCCSDKKFAKCGFSLSFCARLAAGAEPLQGSVPHKPTYACKISSNSV